MRRTLAIAIPIASVALLLAGAVLERSPGDLMWVPLVAASTGVGALLWHRRAGRALGPLFAFVGASIALDVALSGYVHQATIDDLPGADWVAWVFQSAIGLAGAIYLILQLFPTGRPLTPRWRALAWLTLAAIAVSIVGPALGVTANFTQNFPQITHPLQVVSPSVAETLVSIGGLAGVVVLLASGCEIVLRYRRSTGVERAQMKWFTAASAVTAIGVALGAFLAPQPDVPFALLTPLIPIAAGIAILRYRLYDIDLVLSKTLVFALLAAFITVVYVLVVAAIGSITGAGSLFATVIVAVLFQPARVWARRLANRLVFGERATPYEVMAGFSERVADAVSTEEVLPQMAEAAGAGVGAAEVTIRVALPDGGERVERWQGPAAGGRAAEPWVTTIVHQGDAVATLTVTKPANDPLTPAERGLLEDLGAQAGLAVHNVRLTEELGIRLRELDVQAAALRVSRERLVTARDAQRRGLQRDIQEGPERQLLDIGRSLDTVTEPQQLDLLIDRANDTLEGLRDLARGVFPPLLADQGVVPALAAHIRKVGAHTTVDADGVAGRRFDADVEACAYFCCLQAIQNVLRHAGNAPSRVRLELDGDELAFEISDDGPGFDVAHTSRGMGLQIIQDRVDALEGSLSVRSDASGTTVAGRIRTAAHDLVQVAR
ncbi:MAG TPA: ATP-binding protein [Actinomycetota bacterium]|jgi:signal transduction histidine kinase|nr:ATP-binding protein [Actinomycetota bacterium]